MFEFYYITNLIKENKHSSLAWIMKKSEHGQAIIFQDK